MPLPTALLNEQFDYVHQDWSALHTAVSDATQARAEVVTQAAVLATATTNLASAQTAYDAALAAWIADGSPEEGATFDAKESAATALANRQSLFDTAQGQYDADVTFAQGVEAVLMAARKAFARNIAQVAVIMNDHRDQCPPAPAVSPPVELAQLLYQVALGLAPQF